MPTLKTIIKIAKGDYDVLVEQGSITKGGVVYTYDPDETLYMVDDGLSDDYVVLGGGSGKLLSWFASQEDISNVKSQITNVQSDLGTDISSIRNSVSSLSSTVVKSRLTYYDAYFYVIEPLFAEGLVAFDEAGRLLSIQTVGGNNTNHIATTTPFRPDSIAVSSYNVSTGYYYGDNIYLKTNQCYLRHNFNTNFPTRSAYIVYLVGKLDSETGLFTLRQTTNDYYLYFSVPSDDNFDLRDWFDTGYDYIKIGNSYGGSLYYFTLDEHNEVFHFDGTNLIPVSIIDTHNTSTNVITGNANSTANNAATNGNVYLNHIETTPTGKPSVTSSHKIEGVGGTNVSSDANGNITIKNHDVSYATSENDTRGHWTVTIPGITELYDGLKINVRLSTQWYGNGESYNTLNVNGLGPQLVWYRPGERLTSHYYSKYSECTLTYWSSNCGSYTVTTTTGELVKGQTYTGGWMCEYAYYTTDVSNLNTGLSRPTTASALGTHHLCALDKSGRVISLVSPVTSYSSSNPFTPTATAFRPEYIYITAGSFNSGVTISDSYLYTNRMYCYTNYNFNSNPTAAISTIYLVGTLDKTTGLFTLDQTTTGYYLYVPCNADISDLKTYFTAGKYYICIGQSYATSSVYFSKWQNNTVYYFDGTNLVPVIASAEKAKTADEATALSTGTVGALDQPVYFSEGQPVACTDIATKSEVAIKKYPAVTDGYYYGLMDSDENPNKVTEGVDAKGAVALGCNNTIGNRFTFVTGTNNTVSGNSAVAIGQKNTTSGACSFAGGVNNVVSGNYSAIFGNSNTVSGNYANAFGAGNTVSKAGSAAIGLDNIVSSQAAFAEGNGNIICGNASHAEGGRNIAYGATSHAGGSSTSAIGYSSVTYGGSWGMNIYLTGDANATTYTYTLGEADVDPAYRLIVGNGLYLQASPYTTAYITAVDTTNKTITLSTTFNASTALSGQACWLFGTIAKGQYSFAMRGISNGASSWTVNRGGLAIGSCSFVGGNVNIANNNNEVAFGSYNLSNTGTKASAFTLGGGTEESDRKNIFEITSDGSIYASGLGSYTGTNPTSSKSIQEVISEINTTLSGKANTSHTHTKSQITDFPTSMKNPNALTIKLNGTSQGAYDGSSAKEINITAGSVGAATASDITNAINNLDANPEGSSSQGIKVQVKQTDGKVSGVTVSQSNTFATLGTDGKVPSSQLPSYVDDVLEFASYANFPDSGETGKIYVATDTNLTYRWTGSTYVKISQSLALGTTSSTAYYGDKGKVAYDHSQVTTGNPHKVTKSDVGLSNVDNTADSAKSVKYATSAGSASTAGSATTATKDIAGNQINTTYLQKQRVENPGTSSTEVGITPFNVLGYKSSGYPVYTDPEFAYSKNSIERYNNVSGSTDVTITRGTPSEFGITDSGNSSGYVLRIQHTGTNATPDFGGFVQTISSRANAVFVQIIRAKIPVGYKINTASNNMGNSYGDVFITATEGTGKWEWYGRIVHCGSTGTFSTGGHIYLSATTGAAPTSSAPVNWYLSYANVIDITKGKNAADTITIDASGYSSTADSCMPSTIDTLAVYRAGASSGAPGADGNIIAMSWSNLQGRYGSQIYVDCDPTGYMALRQRNGSGVWTNWYQFIHSGNIGSQSVASAGKLTTARSINGTSFNGSADITTSKWGTARTVSISDSDGSNTGSGVSVDGSDAVTLKLPATIKATLKGNADTATTAVNAGTAELAAVATTANSVAWSNVTGKPNSGTYIASTTKNNYEGLTTAAGSDSSWIRTTEQGLIPYSASTSGSSSLGTSSWPFKTVYAKTFYGNLTGNVTGNVSGNVTGNASTATKLQTPRTISLGTGVTSTATSFSGESNITIPVNSIKESYLAWGGKDLKGTYAPIDAALISYLGANRLAFGKATGITIEYSRDSGSTWIDYGASDADKIGLFSGTRPSFGIGKNDSTNKATAAYMLRVTIDTGKFEIYTILNKFMIYCSTKGSTGCYCTIQKALENTPDTYVTVKDKIGISGWSGYNIINVPEGICTYGNTKTTQYGRIRFIFGCTGGSDTYSGLHIIQIEGFGGVGWITPSTMATNGHLYSYDALQNATFPAAITAKGNGIFYGPIYEGGTSSSNLLSNRYAAKSHTHSYAGSSSAGGAATSANKLNTDAGSTTTPVYFSNGVPVALGYTIAKSVPSSAVFTDTHYSSKNVVTANVNSTIDNAATNENVRLNHVENSAVTSSHIIKGTGATTVTSDASGTITINSTDTNTDTKVTAVGNHYTPSKSTTKSASGGTLTDITNSSGTNVVTGVEMDAAGHVTGVTSVALKSTNTNTIYSAGTGISLSGTTFSNSGVRSVTQGSNGYVSVNTNGTSSTVAVYSLPTATASQLGGVVSQTTGTTANRDYKVEVASDGKMKVNVPWTDTNTTYSTGTATTSGLTKLYTSTGSNTDGTMTQSAINTALSGKAASSHNHNDIYYTEAEMNTKLSSKVDNTAAGVSTALNKLTEGTSTPSDSDYYISQYAGGGTTTTTYHRRPLSALWTWIKSKLATVATSGSYSDLSNKPTSLKNPSVLAIGTADTPIISYDGSEVKGLTIKGGGATTVTGDATANSITISSTGVDYTAGTGISISDTTISNSGVTGVKGAADSVYKTGNVNLTPANIGAASASHTHKKSQITDFSVTTADIVNGAVTADKLAAESIIPTKINHDDDNYWYFAHLSASKGDMVVGDAGGGSYKDIQLSNENSANGVPILTVQGCDGESGEFIYDTTLRGINTPTEDNDAANKGYVDNSINSLAVATTTANGLMSATDKSRIDKLSVYTFDFDEINKDVGDSVSATVVDSIRDMLFANIGCIVAAVYGQYKTGACDTRYPVAAKFLNYGSDTNYSININIYAGTTVYQYDILRDASSCTIDSKSTHNLINTSQLTKGGTTSMSNGGVWTAVNAPTTTSSTAANTQMLYSTSPHRIMNLATTAVTQTYTLPASPASNETFEFYKMFTASTLTIKSTATNMYNTRTGSTTKVSSITYSSTTTPSRCKIVCMYVSGAWWVTIENLAT